MSDGIASNLLRTTFSTVPLPLLARELTEQAARRRTFVLRFVFACLLYSVAIWASWGLLSKWNVNTFSILGRGRELFETIGLLQFAWIYLFLPGMTCGVLTSEKERDTLSLLLLTKLSPWTIVLEKLMSRIVPMLSFLLLSMPLVAVAYSLGGIETFEIGKLIWVLVVTTIQVGSIAILCSAWCRTTSAAFLASYLFCAAIIFTPMLLLELGRDSFGGLFQEIELLLTHLGILEPVTLDYMVSTRTSVKVASSDIQFVYLFIGPWLALSDVTQSLTWSSACAITLPMLLLSLSSLFLTRAILWRRAFVQPTNLILKFFRKLDQFFQQANQNRWTKGIVLTNEDESLPLNDPISWRETKKKSLGTTRYLIRLLIVLELPVVIGLLFPFHSGDDRMAVYAPAYVTAWVLWIFVAMVLTIHSTGLIGIERSRQTLDVLLTTRLSTDTIVRQKFAGIWKLIKVMWIPFLTIYLFQFWWRLAVHDTWYNKLPFGLIILRAILAVAIYPPLCAWIGFHMGMICRSQTRAILATFGILVGVMVVPVVISDLMWDATVEVRKANRFHRGTEVWSVATYLLFGLQWLSPAQCLALVDFRFFDGYYDSDRALSKTFQAWLGVVFHFVVMARLLFWLRGRALKSFAAYVHRNDGDIVSDEDIDRLGSIRRKISGSDANSIKS